MDERSSFTVPVRLAAMIVAAWLPLQGSRALAAELTASAVRNLHGYTLAYRGTNFPAGLTVQIVVSDARGPLPLGAATATQDGSFQGMSSLQCVPPGFVAQQQATVSAIRPMGGSLAQASVSFACVLQH